ncbi:DUF1707 SHOCT-like domain-containing protein [Nocardioides mangrovi]|uniref:DUF1707 domain-containing protein n=1 Tax=Nocardioides mangrovi TaxID=2874580 RepID=A0ABS7UDQ8_9ACTN|nr:DUF1707 domain-containing protein [Nocardioides mangrovi]MBZ5738777.1 DUF1707 domain-containing protein [Nocardioides mangrovi]
MDRDGQREVWSSFTHDPRDGQYAPLRASDQDRAVVHQVLDEAYADGRLDREEYDQRTAQVGTVRLLGDINPLLADLVAPRVSPRQSLVRATSTDLERMAAKEWERKRREAVFSFLGASLVTSAIWFATSFRHGDFDPYFFWPAFVIVFSLLHLVRVAASRGEIVDSEVRRLEKRRDKEQRRPGWLR